MSKPRQVLREEIAQLKNMLHEEQMKVKSLEADSQGLDILRMERLRLAEALEKLDKMLDAEKARSKNLLEMLTWERELAKKLALLLARELADDPHNVAGENNV